MNPPVSPVTSRATKSAPITFAACPAPRAVSLRRSLLSAVVLTLVAGCAIVRMPDGVIKGVDLPADLSLFIRKGMHESELIAAFGAPAQRTSHGGTTTVVYTEVYQRRHHRLEFLGFSVTPAGRTRRQLHLLFQEDALKQAWVEVSGGGRASGTTWLVGAPESEGDD